MRLFLTWKNYIILLEQCEESYEGNYFLDEWIGYLLELYGLKTVKDTKWPSTPGLSLLSTEPCVWTCQPDLVWWVQGWAPKWFSPAPFVSSNTAPICILYIRAETRPCCISLFQEQDISYSIKLPWIFFQWPSVKQYQQDCGKLRLVYMYCTAQYTVHILHRVHTVLCILYIFTCIFR